MDNNAFLCLLSNAENSSNKKYIKRNADGSGQSKSDLPLVVDKQTGDCYLDGCLFYDGYDAMGNITEISQKDSISSCNSLNFQSPIQIRIENKKAIFVRETVTATGTILTVPNFQSSRIYDPICYVGEQKIPCMIALRTKAVKGLIATPGETYLVSYFVQVKDLTETHDIVPKAEATDLEIRGGIGTHVLNQPENEKSVRVFDSKNGCWVNKAESTQMFDTGSGDLVAVAEKEPENKKDDFSIVLWAGTVGLGMKESGKTEEVTRTQEEAWEDLILRYVEEANPMELVEVPKMPTVEQNAGSTSVTVLVVTLSLLSLIGILARFLL